MARVIPKSDCKTVRADGTKMVRIGFDVPHTLSKAFKKKLLDNDRTMSRFFIDHMKAYIEQEDV
jgi:hypothetical protein